MRLDAVTGLYYDNARWYDANNSVFVSQDPLGFLGGQTNTQEYCGNSPTNYTDQSGEILTPNTQPSPRTTGFSKILGGLTTAFTGLLSLETGVGLAVLVKGLDNSIAGCWQVYSNQDVPTLTARLFGDKVDTALDWATLLAGNPFSGPAAGIGKLATEFGSIANAIAVDAAWAYKGLQAAGAVLATGGKAAGKGHPPVGKQSAPGGDTGGTDAKPVHEPEPVADGTTEMKVQDSPAPHPGPVGPVLKPNEMIKAAAAKLGYNRRIPPQKAPFRSHGEPVFSNGKRYITPDVDQHSGGVWKMYSQKGDRLGTYDGELNRIGD